MSVGCFTIVSSMANVAKLVALLLILFALIGQCKKKEGKDKPQWAKKDIRDYNEADMERLYDQWEEDEEPPEVDELPEHMRPAPKIDLSKVDPNDPESLLKMSKKGKTLMAFVSVSGKPNPNDLEDLTKLWQSSLMNNHIQCDRFVIDDKRAIFMFRDGSQAWVAKDFLVQQERCEEVTIENKSYPGQGSTKSSEKTEL